MRAVFEHHAAAIARVIDRFEADDSVLGLLLAGSIAHGFETAASDVDVLIVVSNEELERRNAAFDSAYSDEALAGYDGGYIDFKFVSPGYLHTVAERGSEPARFAFDGARVLFSRTDGLESLVAAASAFPEAGREERIARFLAQVEAWRWMAGEAEKKGDPYLLATAVSRLVLFSGRVILAHNSMLYPFHKWFLRVLESAPEQPVGFADRLRAASAAPSAAAASAIADEVLGFADWDRGGISWPNRFLVDTEQAWLRDAAALDDL